MAIDWANVKAVEIPEGEAKEIKVNGVSVWTKPEPEPVDINYFCITALADNVTVSMTSKGTGVPDVSVYSSTDKDTWTLFYSQQGGSRHVGSVNLAHSGDKVYLRGDNTRLFNTTNSGHYFVFNGDVAVSGNIMTLLDSTGAKTDFTTDNECAFYQLFRDCTGLKDVDNLELPARNLVAFCYGNMFWKCGIQRGVTLPSNCTYGDNSLMFLYEECKSLLSVTLNETVWPEGNATQNWFSKAKVGGVFYCPSALDIPARTASYVPSDWTIVRTD